MGRSEREIAWRLRQLLHAHGVDQLRFDTAIASGRTARGRTASPSDTIIEPRTLVTADWGARLDGYCSDCTRTRRDGRAAASSCARSTTSASRPSSPRSTGSGPGMTGVEADALARDVIAAAGYGDDFGHGLGHGVGMYIHEAPRLSTASRPTRSRSAT